MYSTAMNNSIMAYSNIIADISWVFLVGAMNYGAVLYIHLIPDFYIVNVAANHCIKPDTTVLSHYHITNNSSIRSYKTIISKLRMLIKKGKYRGHSKTI